MDGDTIAVEIFPEEEWRRPSDIVLEDKADDPGDKLEEEAVLLKVAKPVDKSDEEITPTGKVVGIIRRKWRQYCGILMKSKYPGRSFKYYNMTFFKDGCLNFCYSFMQKLLN